MDANTKARFAAALIADKYAVNERHAAGMLDSIEDESRQELWFGNGVADFKLLRMPVNGEWEFYNFRNLVHPSLGRIEAALKG